MVTRLKKVIVDQIQILEHRLVKKIRKMDKETSRETLDIMNKIDEIDNRMKTGHGNELRK